MKRTLFFMMVILTVAGVSMAQTGVKKKRQLPYDYGRVVLNNYSEKAGLAPVVFDHWLHRARFTCRLCHVDIAFAMKAGTTGITAADNMSGIYCGSCHNGKNTFQDKKVFDACSKRIPTKEDAKRCDRCHSLGKNVKREYEFAKFTEGFPKERFGNGINWEKAEEDGLIKLTDFLEGVSVRKKNLASPKDLAVKPKQAEMPEIIFSHTKHAVWNGCELCHPEIFGIKTGATKYSMADIFEGRYCGVCHDKVAFPNLDCVRCHTKPV